MQGILDLKLATCIGIQDLGKNKLDPYLVLQKSENLIGLVFSVEFSDGLTKLLHHLLAL